MHRVHRDAQEENVAEVKKWNALRTAVVAAALLTLGAALAVTYGNPQWHWRLYAFQARNMDPQRLEPGAAYTGAWNNWEQDGRLVSTYAYRNGQRDGAYTTYDESGAVVATGQYRNGGFDGVQKMNRDGGLRTEIEYRDGRRHGTETTWYPNGQIAVQAHYANGVQAGPLTEYADTGMILSVTPFYNDKREGVAQIFHPAGAPQWTGTYANDLLNGVSTFYRPDGTIESTRTFLNDALAGLQTDYHPDGKTKMKEFAIAGDALNGVYKEWDEAGKLLTDEVYENGILKLRDGEEVKPTGEQTEEEAEEQNA
jgi:antitoxin component YwqK of YwqJK toxin-antitoxin module